jgi:serine protease Do
MSRFDVNESCIFGRGQSPINKLNIGYWFKVDINMAGKTQLAPWIGGAVIGAVISASFWAGHELWPRSVANLGTQAALPPITAPGGAKLPLAILPLGENTIADIAKQASDSVVNIDISKSYTVPDTQQFGLNGMPFFFGNPDSMPKPEMRKYEARGCGSGLIYRSDGYIITNNHVVGEADKIKVTLNDKRQFEGKVVGRDTFTDLAVVKIDASDLPVAKLGTSKTLRAGDWAIAIGSPLGLDHSVSLGIISALGRSIISNMSNNVELIQTDAAINPGNSGGPLINIHGEVIGINVAIRQDGQNIGFAIPVDIVKEISQQLVEHGTIARAYLGIYMRDLDPELAKSLNLPAETQGVVVAQAMKNGPAQKAGVERLDVIERVDGTAVKSAKEVQGFVLKHKPNDKLILLVSRNGALKPITVTVGDRPTKEQS